MSYSLRADIKDTCGMSQREFAEYIGVSEWAVSRWCTGHIKLPTYVICILSLMDELAISDIEMKLSKLSGSQRVR